MNIKSTYNPHIHHRRSIRLKGYDYAKAGLYFITICCQGRICRFGHVVNGEMILNEFGTVAYNEWVKLSERFFNFKLDVFQIMPNHIHAIILLDDTPVGAGFTPAPNSGTPAPDAGYARNNMNNPNPGFTTDPNDEHRATVGIDDRATAGMEHRATARVAPTVADIVGAYKSLVANGCLEIYKRKNEMMGKLWQRNYYEHIIRNEHSYQRISEYIINNPEKWGKDKFYKRST